jgi:hypothetical protein
MKIAIKQEVQFEAVRLIASVETAILGRFER